MLAGTLSAEALPHGMASAGSCAAGRPVGGVLLQPSTRRLSLYQAMKHKLLGPGWPWPCWRPGSHEAMTDPHSLETISLDEAVCRGLVGPELYSRLTWAECAVKGFPDPFSGKLLSLFQAMKKGLVPAEQAVRLLEAQVATGGSSTRPAITTSPYSWPCSVATSARRWCWPCLTQGIPTPDGQGHTSYAQLLEQCVRTRPLAFTSCPLPERVPCCPHR